MTWIDNSVLWISAVLLVFLGAWFRNFLSLVVPSPQRAILALKNLVFPRPPAHDKVRFVLGWLDNDYKGSNTTAVSTAFADIEGIDLCRSARIVSASGAADEWRAAMRHKAKDLLRAWPADIAVVGRVEKDGEALSLWFIRSDDDMLDDTTSNPYPLRFNRLPKDFAENLFVQIRALALGFAIPKTTNGARRQLSLHQLEEAVPKLGNLFRTLSAPGDRLSLCMVYVLAQSSLGEWLGETERLRSAIEKAKQVTEGADVGDHADALLTTRINLARTLYLLGEREGNPEYLAESISLLEDALGAVDRPDRASITAGIKGLIANALRVVAGMERNPERLHRAASLLESALEVHRQQADTPLVAIAQNNLGLVYLDLANAANQRDLIERAVSLFDNASSLASDAGMVTLCAMAQNNTGQGYEALAESGSRSDLTVLEKSRHHYENAVRGYSKTHTPYHQASAKTNLARVLTTMGALNGSIDYLNQAIESLQDALALTPKDARSTRVGAISAGLGAALLMRGKVRADARDVEKAVPWLEKALDTYDLESSPENWVKLKSNLAMSSFELSKHRNDVGLTAQGFSILEEVLIERDLGPAMVACPEPYIVFCQAIDLVKSMVHQSDYVREWIANWVPVFTDREHEGVSGRALGILQNDLATICQDAGAMTDAVKLYRRALANMANLDHLNETVSNSRATSHPPVPSQSPDTVRLVANVKRNLGTACRMLGEERSSAMLLGEAIALLDEVLAALDPAVDPMDWAITESSKARAYKELYHVEGDVDLLRLSLSAYDEALQYLADGMDSPWHQQVPGKRDEVRRLLEQAMGPPDPSS